MLTAGATLTPPIESSAGANHAAGQQLECIKVSSTCQPYLRLTAASVSVHPTIIIIRTLERAYVKCVGCGLRETGSP